MKCSRALYKQQYEKNRRNELTAVIQSLAQYVPDAAAQSHIDILRSVLRILKDLNGGGAQTSRSNNEPKVVHHRSSQSKPDVRHNWTQTTTTTGQSMPRSLVCQSGTFLVVQTNNLADTLAGRVAKVLIPKVAKLTAAPPQPEIDSTAIAPSLTIASPPQPQVHSSTTQTESSRESSRMAVVEKRKTATTQTNCAQPLPSSSAIRDTQVEESSMAEPIFTGGGHSKQCHIQEIVNLVAGELELEALAGDSLSTAIVHETSPTNGLQPSGRNMPDALPDQGGLPSSNIKTPVKDAATDMRAKVLTTPSEPTTPISKSDSLGRTRNRPQTFTIDSLRSSYVHDTSTLTAPTSEPSATSSIVGFHQMLTPVHKSLPTAATNPTPHVLTTKHKAKGSQHDASAATTAKRHKPHDITSTPPQSAPTTLPSTTTTSSSMPTITLSIPATTTTVTSANYNITTTATVTSANYNITTTTTSVPQQQHSYSSTTTALPEYNRWAYTAAPWPPQSQAYPSFPYAVSPYSHRSVYGNDPHGQYVMPTSTVASASTPSTTSYTSKNTATFQVSDILTSSASKSTSGHQPGARSSNRQSSSGRKHTSTHAPDPDTANAATHSIAQHATSSMPSAIVSHNFVDMPHYAFDMTSHQDWQHNVTTDYVAVGEQHRMYGIEASPFAYPGHNPAAVLDPETSNQLTAADAHKGAANLMLPQWYM